MNIFTVHTNPKIAAQMLCDKHVVKMILESAQMLCTAVNEASGLPVTPYKSTHKNHPCTVWVGVSRYNALWLYDHMIALGEEYAYRYSTKETKTHATITKMQECNLLQLISVVLPHTDPTDFPQAMPDQYKVEGDSVAAYRAYYRGEKKELLSYSRRPPPDWLKDIVKSETIDKSSNK